MAHQEDPHHGDGGLGVAVVPLLLVLLVAAARSAAAVVDVGPVVAHAVVVVVAVGAEAVGRGVRGSQAELWVVVED